MNIALGTRLALVVLAALLTLPTAPTAPEVAAKNRSRTVTRTFRNPAAIALPNAQTGPVSGSVYPSEIAVGGLRRAKIRDVNVRLNDYTHANGADVDVLLVAPGSQTAIVMSRVGEETAGNAAVTLRFDDEAAAVLPDEEVQGGAFRPTNHNGVAVDFNDPAPTASANAALSVFDGGNPTGTWRLFVQDAFPTADPGTVAGGWTLELKVKLKAKKKR